MCRKSTQLDRLLIHCPPGPDPLTKVSINSSSFSTIFFLPIGGFVANVRCKINCRIVVNMVQKKKKKMAALSPLKLYKRKTCQIVPLTYLDQFSVDKEFTTKNSCQCLCDNSIELWLTIRDNKCISQ